ncbi:MAG: DUF4870 domain-containing protein [Thermococci archaeon]|nr:DUF4870 domain-containing protein [Thermococci archaeon]
MEGNGTKTDLGLDENVEALLAYLLQWISGLVLLLVEKKSDYVRFHAMQSFVMFLTLWIVGWFVAIIPFIGWVLSRIVWVLTAVAWIVGMVKAYQGEYYRFPVFSDLAEQVGAKMNL